MTLRKAFPGPIRVFARCQTTTVSRHVERYSLFTAAIRTRASHMARANAIAQSIAEQAKSIDAVEAQLCKIAADNLKPCRTPIDVLVHRLLQTMILQPDAYRAPTSPCPTDLFPIA